MTSKVISSLSPGVDGLRPHLNQPESSLSKNINKTDNSPPRNAKLRNQPKHLTVVKPRRKRSVLAPLKTSCSHKSKSLACYEGLDSLSVVKSLTKACISQNYFTSAYKNKKLWHMINPCFPLRRACLLYLC